MQLRTTAGFTEDTQTDMGQALSGNGMFSPYSKRSSTKIHRTVSNRSSASSTKSNKNKPRRSMSSRSSKASASSKRSRPATPKMRKPIKPRIIFQLEQMNSMNEEGPEKTPLRRMNIVRRSVKLPLNKTNSKPKQPLKLPTLSNKSSAKKKQESDGFGTMKGIKEVSSSYPTSNDQTSFGGAAFKATKRANNVGRRVSMLHGLPARNIPREFVSAFHKTVTKN